MVFNTVLLLFICNVISLIILQFYEKPLPILTAFEMKHVKKVYPELSEKETYNLLTEMYTRGVRYESYTQFKERQYSGEYINVTRHGFRVIKNQREWPPNPQNFNVFVFGGSTTFGYGVQDEQTIASYLQEIFSSNYPEHDFAFYNFGRGYYYSTQERVLFEQLLTSEFVPDMVIFIDGLNEFTFEYIEDEPWFSADMDSFVEFRAGKGMTPYFTSLLIKELPIIRLGAVARDTFQIPITIKRFVPPKKTYQNNNDDSTVESLIKQYLENKKIIESISNTYGVTPVFVWQPIAIYKYDLQYHLFADDTFEKQLAIADKGYHRMETIIKKEAMGNSFLWCADIQENMKKPLYIDRVHYTPEMNEYLAEMIFALIEEQQITSSPPP